MLTTPHAQPFPCPPVEPPGSLASWSPRTATLSLSTLSAYLDTLTAQWASGAPRHTRRMATISLDQHSTRASRALAQPSPCTSVGARACAATTGAHRLLEMISQQLTAKPRWQHACSQWLDKAGAEGEPSQPGGSGGGQRLVEAGAKLEVEVLPPRGAAAGADQPPVWSGRLK